MIQKIIEMLNYGTVDDEIIHIKELCLDDNNIECVKYLYEKNCLESYLDIDAICIGKDVSFDIIWSDINALGVYKYKHDFVAYNLYKKRDEFYIYEINCHNDYTHEYTRSYSEIVGLIDALLSVANHKFEDEDCVHIVLSQNNQSVVIPLEYSSCDINTTLENISAISNISCVLREDNEKQRLFINEIIEYVIETKENVTFSTILKNILLINLNARNAYDFYLSNFSTNKLKFEIDSKAIDFTQKIQSVINDAQTKLIAIPTAFVLATAAMDFESDKIMSGKNISIIISLWIFALLIQLFLSNQKSILELIKVSIHEYKEAFKQKDIKILSVSFDKVDKALLSQIKRLRIIEIVLWIIPMLLTVSLIVIYYTINICIILKVLILPILFYTLLVIKIMTK